jgi:hypothetical protein
LAGALGDGAVGAGGLLLALSGCLQAELGFA